LAGSTRHAHHETFVLGILHNYLIKCLLEGNGGGPSNCSTWILTKKEVVKGPHFPVTNALMPPRREPRHSYERSIVCHKSFRVYRSQLLRPGGMFCTQRCFWQAWRAFRRALAKGQLEDILEMPASHEVLNADAPATRRRLYEQVSTSRSGSRFPAMSESAEKTSSSYEKRRKTGASRMHWCG
jgi:hypothetical protein